MIRIVSRAITQPDKPLLGVTGEGASEEKGLGPTGGIAVVELYTSEEVELEVLSSQITTF